MVGVCWWLGCMLVVGCCGSGVCRGENEMYFPLKLN